MLRTEERAPQVGVQHLVELLGGELVGAAVNLHPGVVAKYVEPAPFAGTQVDVLPDLLLAANVGGQEQSRTTFGPQLGQQGLSALLVHVGDDNGVAARGET